jgi:hypothetical protein
MYTLIKYTYFSNVFFVIFTHINIIDAYLLQIQI